MRAFALVSAASILLAGCATDQVILLPNEDGNPDGALAVLASDGNETVIDRPNTQATLRDGPTRLRAAGQLSSKYGALLETLPPSAKQFAITFPVSESRIFEGQRKILDLIRAELSVRPGAQIEVAGFTDSTGDDRSNDTLSKQRAETVARELRESGFQIDPDDAVGRGEYEAKAALGDNVSDESYRRVLVIVR